MPDELFLPFNFRVDIYQDQEQNMLCQGYFSEVSGLEITMEPRAIAVGGKNWGEIQRVGPTRFSPVVLRRGVTSINDLWSWFDATTRGNNYGYRLHGKIHVFNRPQSTSTSADGASHNQQRTAFIWELDNILPTRFKGPDLSSVADQVAIEELTLVHEGLRLVRPSP